MSYLRWTVGRYVDSECINDYVFLSAYKKEGKETEYIEDYGKITDEGIVELLNRIMFEGGYDDTIKEHVIQRLSERLNVKLRKKVLSEEESCEIWMKRMKELKKEFKVMKNGNGKDN